MTARRRIRALHDLTALSEGARDAAAKFRACASVLAANREDLPFAALYFVPPGSAHATCAASFGVAPDAPFCPAVLSVAIRAVGCVQAADVAASVPWQASVHAAMAGSVAIGDVAARHFASGTLIANPLRHSPAQVMVAPIMPPGRAPPLALLVCGLNPFQPVQGSYGAFLDQVISRLGSVLADPSVDFAPPGTSFARPRERRCFLATLGELLRGSASPEVVMRTVGAAFGQYIGASRAGFADGASPQADDALYAAIAALWHDDLAAGRTVAVADTNALPRVRALLAAPLLTDGKLQGAFCQLSEHPRPWTAAEVTLAADVAERTWSVVRRMRAEAALRRDIDRERRAIVALEAAAERQRLLIDELNHRVKNTLAVVQSLAMQSLCSAAGLDDFTARFGSRLQALARAHDLLTREAWEGATLRDVADAALGPWCADERVRLQGADVQVSPRQALALSMAFGELATNAARHGALSVPFGRVLLTWQQDCDGAVALEWREEGGPTVRPPAQRGLGSRLLGRPLAAELGGSVELTFAPGGVGCLFQFNAVPLAARHDGVTV